MQDEEEFPSQQNTDPYVASEEEVCRDIFSVDRYIREQFDVPDSDLRTYSPLTLAYIGDCVFELIIRTVVVGKGNSRPNRLHGCTTQVVKAQTQAQMADVLQGVLTDEEAEVYRRGHNAKSMSPSKHASLSDYHKATGFEAVIGYLYLSDRFERAVELTRRTVEQLDLLQEV